SGGIVVPGSLLWIVALIALAAVVLCAALPYSIAAAQNATHRFGGLALVLGGLGAGGLTALVGFTLLDQMNQSIHNMLGLLNTADSPIPFSVDLGYGFYVLLAAFAIVALGGILVLLRRDAAPLSGVPQAVPMPTPPMPGV